MARKRDGEPARGYHHGDLRRRLIEVGEEILEEVGVEGFTLRECARRAGVSPSAPSHHFGSTSGLLTAIATLGFVGLGDAQDAALALAGPDPRARVRAIGEAYIRHAVAHPARYRVTFGHLPLDESDPAFLAAASRALAILRRELAGLRGGPVPDSGDLDFDAAVAFTWSAAHGFARLLIDGQIAAVGPDHPPEVYLGPITDRFLSLVGRALDPGSHGEPTP